MDDALTSTTSGNDQKSWTQEWLDGHLYASSGPKGTLPENFVDDQGFATRLYTLCLCLLRYLCRHEQKISSKTHHASALKEELGRLYLWGEAFKDGKLDRALEYCDDVRGNVLDSLRDIGLCPSSTSALLPSSLQNDTHELRYLMKQVKIITSARNHAATPISSDRADESDTDEENSSDDENTFNVVEELRLQIRWLTQLGPVLEQNLFSAQEARIQATLPAHAPFCVSGPAEIYVSLVREKYKQAQDQLIERLGEANWQRHISVRKSMEASANVAEEKTAPVGDSAVAQSVFRPYSAFHDSGIGPSIPAQTEYAASHTSFQSSNTGGERESVRVPATPVEVNDGKPFQCFLCKCILSDIKNRVDWKMHVFADLQPYICTFADCPDELAQFPNRAAWAEHEFSQHRITQSWSCPECPQAFISVSKWQSHIQERHRLFFSGHTFIIAKDMAYRSEATQIENDECPLCRTVVGKPRRAFVKHVGRHMEEIALMALPRNVEEDSEEDSLSTDRISLEGSRTSFYTPRYDPRPPPLPPPRYIDDITAGSDPRWAWGGSPTSFACEHCDQTFLFNHELIAHKQVHSLKRRGYRRGMACTACKRRKTKCTHFDRVWENSQQKRDHCEIRDQPCGPNVGYSADPAVWRRAAMPEDEKEVGSGRATEQPRGHPDGSVTSSAPKVLPSDNQRRNAETMGTTGQAEPSNIGVAQHSLAFPALYPRNVGLGRVDALGCPSLDHPPPAPPLWLSQAVWRLQQVYPDDLFEATMRYKAVSTTTDLPIALSSTELAPPDTKFMYYPRIKCLDCPGKLYTPGPDLGLADFEVHTKNRLHREKVERRKSVEVYMKNKVHREKIEEKPGKTVQLPSSPKPEPDEPGAVRLNGKPTSINALPAISRDYEDSGEQKVSPLREPSGGRELKRYSRSVTGAEKLEVPVNDVEKLDEKLGKPVRLSSARERGLDEPGTMPTTSSYWSVPEQTDFHNLVRYFGTNWKAIADTMKTKSHIMIKNFYNRKSQEGDSGQQLEEEVHRADALRASGADMGPMPAPVPR